MRFYLVLGTEFELSVAVQEGAGPITKLWAPASFVDGDTVKAFYGSGAEQ